MNRYLKKPMNSSRKSTQITGRPSNGQSSSPVLILAFSASWQSALKRANFECPAVWALDENDLVAEAIAYPSAAVVVELPEVRSEQFCKLRPLFWPPRRIFVVGDSQIRSAEKWLRSLGIAEVFYVPADLKRLCRMITRHNQTYPGPAESLENQIHRQLPWS